MMVCLTTINLQKQTDKTFTYNRYMITFSSFSEIATLSHVGLYIKLKLYFRNMGMIDLIIILCCTFQSIWLHVATKFSFPCSLLHNKFTHCSFRSVCLSLSLKYRYMEQTFWILHNVILKKFAFYDTCM